MPSDSSRSPSPDQASRLLAMSPALLCVLDAESVVLFANGAPSAIVGSEGLAGTKLIERVHAEDAAAATERLREAMLRGGPVRFGCRMCATGGGYRWVAWTVSRGDDGTVCAVLEDTTEQKWVEHELAASLSLVEATMESTADGLVVIDQSGKTVTFNRKFLEMWSIPDAVVFQGLCEIDAYCQERLATPDAHMAMVRELETEPDRERYDVLTLRDGRVFEQFSRARRTAAELFGRVWSFRDVTQRVSAERELRDHLAMGIEHAVEGICRLDNEWRFTSVNGVYARMLGYDESAILGKTWGTFTHPDDREQAVQTPLADGKNEFEARFVRKDGAIVLLRTLLVRADAGGYHAFVRDITEQHEMQERLLLSDRLVSMGTLAAGVAHEINNPLSFVIANLDLLREAFTTLGEEVGPKWRAELAELLDEIRQGAERIRRIVRDMKTFSRPDDSSSGPVDVRPVLESSISMAWNEIRHRARLVKDYGAGTIAQGNDARLGQVFLNLLINAAQAIPGGNVEKNEIRIVTRTEADGRVVVEIRDTGAGIPPGMLPHIFDPFFTTKPVGAGTGLGLSVCHGIIAKLGGEISADSIVGGGTTFRVTLPSGQPRPKTVPPVSPELVAPSKNRVLVVDDEPSIGNVLRRILAREYEVVVCSSGRAALEVLDEPPGFDVILCDIMMPDVSGMDVYEEMQRMSPDITKRIVFMTGGIFTERARAFLEKVPNPCLDKPLDVQALRACVRDVLRACETD